MIVFPIWYPWDVVYDSFSVSCFLTDLMGSDTDSIVKYNETSQIIFKKTRVPFSSSSTLTLYFKQIMALK